MNTIWKFPLQVTASQFVAIPWDCKPLAVQVQDGAIFMWAAVNSDSGPGSRRIVMCGTGGRLAPNATAATYIGTVQLEGYVWHFFDGGKA
jgi:Tfp pilus tip-associated adhesin PilY1